MKEFFKKHITKKRIAILAVIVAINIAFSLVINHYGPDDLKYVEFVEMVENKEVKEVDLKKDGDKISVISKNDKKYVTDNPRSDTFKEDLLKKGISVVNSTPPSKLVASFAGILFQFGFLVLIIVIVIYFMKTSSSSTKLASENSTVNFDDIAGNMEAKGDMEFLVSFLKNPGKYKSIGAKLPKGVVLYGPPGTGKTLMARAVAGEAKVPFYYVSGSDFIEMYAGLGAKRVRDLFKAAKENSPSIVFIDEIDAIGSHRGKDTQSSENDQTINALLSELDGFDSNDSVITIVATNRIEDLDSALIRPGRFDRHVNIGLPDYKDRKVILENYSKGKKLDEDIDLDSLANITIGFSGASLEALMNEAAIIAVNKGSDVIRHEDIDDSYFKIAMKGSKKINKNENRDEVELIAYHEAGHALTTKLLTDNHIHKVTIIPSTSGAGGAVFSVPKKTSLISKKELLNNVMILYAGRAAEEIFRGNKDDITSGASSDIQQATNLIKAYFSELGMSSKFGMMAIENDELYLDEAVKLSKDLYEKTLELLNENNDKLKIIADKLMEKETLSGKDLEELLSE